MYLALIIHFFTGRTSFYDEVGVIRDVMQNHLTEMLSLIAMELPNNSGNITEILQRKVQFLQQIQPLSNQGIVIGQYDSYEAECHGEAKQTDGYYHTTTPTFAAAVLKVNNARWEGVPFLLMAGKKLDTKASYVRVVFKRNVLCVREADPACDARHEEVLFYIGGGGLNSPAKIATTRGLPKPGHFPGWAVGELEEGVTLGVEAKDAYHLVPQVEEDAYSTLIEAVYDGQRHLFTDSASLLESWRFWTPVLRHVAATKPRIYDGGADGIASLNFKIIGSDLAYTSVDDVFTRPASPPEPRQVPTDFCSHKLISTATEDLIAKLAVDITAAAEAAVLDNGVFHMALSGGNTPVKVLQHLVSYSASFPWFHTHVWLVDERCVPLDSHHSNFDLINRHLLPYVRVPYLQVHPMPVEMSSSVCGADSNGDELYESDIKRTVPNESFDFVLLGVGGDGHTASLFPQQPSLDASDKLVTYSHGGPVNIAEKRMTLTFTAINQAARVAVLATGKNKHEIINQLSHCPENTAQYPIAGVKLSGGKLVWYIDHEAFFDDK